MNSEPIIRADLHVHSIHSERPSEWILKTLGTRESYTQPEHIYRQAREHGMDLVTITDHNTIDGVLELRTRYGRDILMGVEATTYFPEDGCKIHVLIYGFSEGQFAEINRARASIYDLRDYLRREGLAHSLAHATYALNGKLAFEHLEKLILLFDVFEGLNGFGSARQNGIWQEALFALTPEHIQRLYERHRIEPFGPEPWRKGITGGSDDHSGMFIGTTWTRAPAGVDFLQALRDRRTQAAGRSTDFRSMAYAIYKIGYDHTKHHNIRFSASFLNSLNALLFEGKSFSFMEKLYIHQLKNRYRRRNQRTKALVLETLHDTFSRNGISVDQKIERVYDAIALFSDDFFQSVLESTIKDFERLDLINIVRKLSSSLFGVLLVLPFLSTLKHLFKERRLLGRLRRDFTGQEPKNGARVAWFTDTINDLNGVSTTLQKLGWLAREKGKDLSLVCCLADGESRDGLPPNLTFLPSIFDFQAPLYPSQRIKVPSILRSLRLIQELDPDQIVVSTPGPVGLLGLLAGWLLAVPVKAVFHSDFSVSISSYAKDNSLAPLVESALRWFYQRADRILVPSEHYREVLRARGYDTGKLELFRRGIDPADFHPQAGGRKYLRDHLGLADGPVLLYAGRIAREKNLHLLKPLCESLRRGGQPVNLVLAGDGPDLAELRKSFQDRGWAHFPGKVPHATLPFFYSGADLLVFPSGADTFGMSVLEAQACGLPAVVSDAGGPQEIIIDGETGLVAREGDLEDWQRKVQALLGLAAADPLAYRRLRVQAAARARQRFDWSLALRELFQVPAIDAPQAAAKKLLPIPAFIDF
jgi:glycosyltransferase involved in cell wall biosynthesis